MLQLIKSNLLTTLAFSLAIWAVFFHLGDFALLSPDEGRNAEVAREMKEAGTWLVPTYNGATYLDKPAFFFKAVALSLELFGNHEFAARLPSALFGLGVLVMMFLFCQRVYDRETALMAIVVIALTPLFMAFSRIVIFDMTLAFFVCAAILAAYRAEECEGGRQRCWYGVAAIAAGIATLVKGPVGFLLPFLVMAVFNWSLGRGAAIRRFFRPLNIVLFLATFLPWFIGLSLACPDFPYYGIMKESIARFTTTEFRRTQPVYYYALIIAGTFFAWSLLLPEAIRLAWRRRKRLSRPDLFFICWALTVVLFFTSSQSKLPGYILTGVIALGVLTGRLFVTALRDGSGEVAAIIRRGCLALGLLAGAAASVVGFALLQPEFGLERHWLKPEFISHFGPVMPRVALSFGLVSLMALLSYRFGRPRHLLAAFLSMPIALLTLAFQVVPSHADIKSARPLVAGLPASIPVNAEVACIQCLPHGLPFYMNRLVTIFSEGGGELTSNYVLFSLGEGNQWPEYLVPYAKMGAWLDDRSRPVLLLARGERLRELGELAAERGVKPFPLGEQYQAVLLPPVKN